MQLTIAQIIAIIIAIAAAAIILFFLATALETSPVVNIPVAYAP